MMRKVGFVFPGQGSQTVGMLAEIAQVYPDVTSIYAEASKVLGYDLWELVQKGPAEVLDQTQYTQPALLTASYALWKVIQANTKEMPALLAGHSLGEYTALVCANAISFVDGVRLVAARGQFMQEAVPVGQGALAAIIGLNDVKVFAICDQAAQANEVLAPANFNSPGQVVIAGHATAVQRAIILAKSQGARIAKILPVSSPSHCSLMGPAAKKLELLLKDIPILPPRVPIVNNVDVALYQDTDTIRQGLVRQLSMPVRWVEIMHFFVNKGISSVVECGPGKVLTGLNKRIVSSFELLNTADLASLQAVLI